MTLLFSQFRVVPEKGSRRYRRLFISIFQYSLLSTVFPWLLSQFLSCLLLSFSSLNFSLLFIVDYFFSQFLPVVYHWLFLLSISPSLSIIVYLFLSRLPSRCSSCLHRVNCCCCIGIKSRTIHDFCTAALLVWEFNFDAYLQSGSHG